MLENYTGPAIRWNAPQSVTGPRPTIVTLALSADETIAPPWSLVADPLVARGWLSVTLNAPAHGIDVRTNENAATPLVSWRNRIIAGEPLVADFVDRVRAMIDSLRLCGAASADGVVLVGASRGGFLAAHIAAALAGYVRALVLIVPVTDLAALEEFADVAGDLRLASVRLHPLARRLAALPIWMKSGSTDTRVDEARTMAFAADLQAAGASLVHVIDPQYGHSLNPLESLAGAVEWIRLRTML